MNAPQSLNLYTYNRFQGASPKVNSIGLPSEFDTASLPTSIPHAVVPDMGLALDSNQQGELPYSPGIMEMSGHTPSAVPFAPAATPKAPGLWAQVGKAIFGGTVPVTSVNSTSALTSGASAAVNTSL